MDQSNIPKDFPMEQALAFAKSPAGQQLMNLLRQNGSADLDKAAKLAASGDTTQARDALSSLLDDPQVRQLLKQFGG